jgi:hypothetical protein
LRGVNNRIGEMEKEGTCKASDCARQVVGKGYCRKHYRLWKAGEMPKPRYKTCTAEKCRKPRAHGSLCEEHFNAQRRTPATAPSAPAAPAASA